MKDRPREDGEPADGAPGFQWLYSEGREPRPDETRAMPVQPRPGDSTPAPPPPRSPAPAPASSPGAGRPRRRRGFRFWLRLVLALLLAWILYLVAVPFYAWSKVDQVAFEPKGDRPAEQPGTTYLLVGSDSRAGLTKEERREYATGNASGQRTDTIMLLHTGSGPNVLMSIPRDSLVEIPGHGTSKINAAYAYGGPRLLVRTIELNTGIRIDEYAEIGLGGVVDVVDAVGGITICPTSAMRDPLAGLDIEKGCQEADGRTALGYARSRKTSNLGDLDRAKHQREVVAAVGDEVLSPATVLNPVRYWRVAMAAPDSFAFGEGMSTIGAAKWARAMTSVGMTCGVPIADMAVHWDTERSQQMFGYLIQDKTDEIPKALCTPSGLPKSITG